MVTATSLVTSLCRCCRGGDDATGDSGTGSSRDRHSDDNTTDDGSSR